MFSGAWRGPCPDVLQHELTLSGYGLHACSQPLPHPTGALITGAHAQDSHEAAQLLDDALIIGIAGLPGFDAQQLAQQWSARTGLRLYAQTVMLDGTPAAGWAPASLAAQIERSPDIVIQPLVSALGQHAAVRVIVPAVLGVLASAHARVSDAVGTTVGEALGMPPSLPGWRLHHALRRTVSRAGITVIEGRGLASEPVNGRINTIQVSNGDVIHARTYILATGKYAAGGIEANGTLREPAFGCPVWIDHLGERFTVADSLILTDPVRTEDQPLLRAGVHVDAEQRPVATTGDVVYSNVLVAGSIRADWSITSHGIGDAATDGWTAGVRAVTP
jgi:anaerobic glycerol-3-phosphate dehydrogenase